MLLMHMVQNRQLSLKIQIEILSYLEVEKYIIEFTTEFFLSEESINVLKTLEPLLKQLKSDFSYTVLPTKEITFTLTMPYENIRF